jgi:DNA-binding transcriptional ArsR family regulator
VDAVFRALADRTRRQLLDRLFKQPGQTLSELCRNLDMSRQAVSKHLLILEEANLVVTRWAGREKYHYLNPVPVRAIHDRWISKYAERDVEILERLKQELEEKP